MFKAFRGYFFPILLLGSVLFAAGCGYTQKTVLPKGIKTIYVKTVQNKVPLEKVYAYTPGLEMTITNAVTRRLIQDGNLKVVPEKEADAVLEAYLTEIDQGGTRFTNLESIAEYRMFITVAARLMDRKTGEVIWEEPNFSGDAEYFAGGSHLGSRDEAAQRASEKLAVNLVDRIVEDW